MAANAAMRRAIVAGHICVDLIPHVQSPPSAQAGRLTEIGALAVRPGGCVANTGRSLAMLGSSVQLVADVGNDHLGTTLVAGLSRAGADTTGLHQVGGASTSYSIVLDAPNHDRTVWHHVGANAGFDATRVDPGTADLVHLGYPSVLPSLIADHGDKLCSFLRRCRTAGATTSIDLATIDPGSPVGELNWTTIFDAMLPLTDVFTPSIDDLTTALALPRTTDSDQIQALGREMLRRGVAAVLLTAGENGMYLFTGTASRLGDAGSCFAGKAQNWADLELYERSRATDVVSTTGAGDAATAGLLHSILGDDGPRTALANAAEAAAHQVSGVPARGRRAGVPRRRP